VQLHDVAVLQWSFFLQIEIREQNPPTSHDLLNQSGEGLFFLIKSEGVGSVRVEKWWGSKSGTIQGMWWCHGDEVFTMAIHSQLLEITWQSLTSSLACDLFPTPHGAISACVAAEMAPLHF